MRPRAPVAGRRRELALAGQLRADGHVVYRLAHGHADLIVLKAGATPLLVQVKSTAGGPFERFAPAERAELALEAIMAGADCTLAWWPARGELEWYPQNAWPLPRRRVPA